MSDIKKNSTQIAEFMFRARTLAEIQTFSNVSQRAIKLFIKSKISGFDIHQGPPAASGEITYIAVPVTVKFAEPKLESPRMWDWCVAKDQPYGFVKFHDKIKDKKLQIVPLDGILYGDPAHDASKFNAIINRIAKDPNIFCFLNGDIIAAITGRGNKEQILLGRTSEFVDKIQKIAHKILWAQQGCLENKSLRAQGFDPLAYFCEKLEIPYFTEPVYIDLEWKSHKYRLWAMHGHSTAQVKGAKMNALRRPAQMHNHTHFIIGGHIGDAMWNSVNKLVRDPLTQRLRAKIEFHIILGNFKKYLGTSSSRKGYTPASTETIILLLEEDGTHHVKTANWKIS